MQRTCLKVFPEEETFKVANSNNIKNPAILQTSSLERPAAFIGQC